MRMCVSCSEDTTFDLFSKIKPHIFRAFRSFFLSSTFIIYNNLYTESMAFEDPNFKPLGACEDEDVVLIDDSYKDAWSLYINSSYETLSEEDRSAILFELQQRNQESYSVAEQEFMDSFTESTKSFDRELSPAEVAWEKYLTLGIDKLNGIEAHEITVMFDQTGESNFVIEQFKADLRERRDKERLDRVGEYREAA